MRRRSQTSCLSPKQIPAETPHRPAAYLWVAHNDKAAFTTFSYGPGGIVRVKGAAVQKSKLSVEDIKEGIPKNDTHFVNTLKAIGPLLEVYEIHFKEASLTEGRTITSRSNSEQRMARVR